jgi:hypothetical protein
MLALTQHLGVGWGLHDLYNLALTEAQKLGRYLQGTPAAIQIVERILLTNSGETAANVGSSLLVELQKIRALAAHQYHTPKARWIGLDDILRSGGILLVGQDHLAKSSSAVLMQLVFRKLYSQVEALLDSNRRKIFCYMDELAALGRVPGLEDFLATTRSRGVMMNMATQSWGKLVQLYGQEVAWSIVGNCDYHTILRCDPHSAEFASQLMGTSVSNKRTVQFNLNQGLLSHGISYNEDIKSRFLASEFMDLRKASAREGIHFVMKSDLKGIRRVVVSAKWVNENCTIPASNDATRVPKQAHQTTLPVWNPGFGAVITSQACQSAYNVSPSLGGFFDMMRSVQRKGC